MIGSSGQSAIDPTGIPVWFDPGSAASNDFEACHKLVLLKTDD
ncbi:MAG TPA: hypothetical protein VFM77_07575 [Terriglobales bacterium]|nr:hypothetical protein [Terriglobales bacterium]